MPLVSVVVPAYNPGPFLERSVGSVLRQSVGDLECVVVDDGSSEDLGASPVLNDPRVRLHRQENRGVSVARNVGVAMTNSEYVAFLDQDDEWLPGKLADQLEAFEVSPQASFCHTPFIWVLPSGERPSAPQQVTYSTSLSGHGGHVCLSSVLVPRTHHDAVGGHDPLLAQQQDWDFILKLLAVLGVPVATKGPAVRYHVHGGNASRDYEAAEREAQLIHALHRAHADRIGDSAALAAIRRGARLTRTLHGHQAVDQLRESVSEHDWHAALHHLRRGIVLDPAVVLRAFATKLDASARGKTSMPRHP